MLLLNLILALIWMALQSSFGFVDFVVGFSFGFIIIALSQRVLVEVFVDVQRRRNGPLPGTYVGRTWTVISFIGFALWSIIKSNIDVAKIVLSPKLNLKPGIVAIPLDVESDAGITTLANLITLTPGTVTLDVSSDRKTMYIHALDVSDVQGLRDDTKAQFERRVMEIFP